MALPSIRGHQNTIKFFANGANAGVVNITSADINQDSTFSRSMYIGNQVPEGDQAIEGWSGSIDVEVKGDAEDILIDSLIQGNLAGIGVDEVTMILSELYPNGQIASYVYFDMQVRISKRVGGLSEKTTKRLDWQASGRVRL